MYNYLSSIKTELKIYKCKRKNMQKKTENSETNRKWGKKN